MRNKNELKLKKLVLYRNVKLHNENKFRKIIQFKIRVIIDIMF